MPWWIWFTLLLSVIYLLCTRLSWSNNKEQVDIEPSLEKQPNVVVTRLPARLDNLPFDVCAEVYSYLSVRDLCSLEQASTTLHRLVNHHHIWSRVVADIHQVKPLNFCVDPSLMTGNELKTMAMRAFRLHRFFSSPSHPKLVYRGSLDKKGVDARMLPNEKYATLDDDGRLRLYSVRSGVLECLPPLKDHPNSQSLEHLATIRTSVTTSILVHYAVYLDPSPDLRYSIIRLYSAADRFQLIWDLMSPHWVISCSADDQTFAYAWIGPQRECFVRLRPIPGRSHSSTIPLEGYEVELSGYDIEGAALIVPRPVSIALASHKFIVLANRLCICVYRIPDHATDGAILAPVWKHVPSRPYRMANPDIFPIPSSHANHLRLAIYHGGVVHTLDLQPCAAADSALLQDITLFKCLSSHPFIHVGASTVLSLNDLPQHVFPFVHFLFARQLNRFTDRLQCQSLTLQGTFQVYENMEHYDPAYMSLDEDSGLLLLHV